MKGRGVKDQRLEELESNFRPLLISCLEECRKGRWGLFGQNDGIDGIPYLRSDNGERVREIALKIHALRAEFGQPNELVERFLYYCSLRGPHIKGEPKLAAAFLNEILNDESPSLGGDHVAVNHEEETIKAFILPNQQDRYLEFLKVPKKRAKFIAQLAHFKHLNSQFAFSIPGKSNPSSLLKLLGAKGAGPQCWVISENPAMDAREMNLETALKGTIGYGMGTIISCLPGKLAYFEDEEERYVLQR